MKVRTNIAMYGRNSGVVFDLPKEEAESLIAMGNASLPTSEDDGPVYVRPEDKQPVHVADEPVVETAAVEVGPENADAAAAQPKPRRRPAKPKTAK